MNIIQSKPQEGTGKQHLIIGETDQAAIDTNNAIAKS